MKYIFIAICVCFSVHSKAEPLELIGYVPSLYLNQKNSTYTLAKIVIEDRLIQVLEPISKEEVEGLEDSGNRVILKNGASFDVIYPGLLDLHSHTKQNNLPLWDQMHGQFDNRHEWRDLSSYTYLQNKNMNPWANISKSPMECLTFRWSELQAMVLGTTYLQGPSSAGCVRNFAIHKLEDGKSYISNLANISAPVDLVTPREMTFVWNEIRPYMMEQTGTETYEEAMEQGMTYEAAFAGVIHKYCPDLVPDPENFNVNGPEAKKLFKNKCGLLEGCGIIDEKCGITEGKSKDEFPKYLIRYMSFTHPTYVSGKINYMNREDRSAFIVHLAEGRSSDIYNQLEFDLLKIFGLDRKGVSLVHGVLEDEDLEHMGRKGMGLIWSPFSNLLLYNETANILKALESGVTVAMGSDWTPTGSKSVLEELKIARAYIRKKGLSRLITDKVLYDMVTQNAAKLINHWVIDEEAGEHGVGRIAEGAMGTVIVVKKSHKSAYTNLILAGAEDINLVVVDGKLQYGNKSYFDQIYSNYGYEVLPQYYETLNEITPDDYPVDLEGDTMSDIVSFVKSLEFEATDSCHFKDTKIFIHQDTLWSYKKGADFYSQTRMNMDRFADIQKLIGVGIMTQTWNARDENSGKPEYRVERFPSLFSCNDPKYMERFENFIEFEVDKNTEQRDSRRERLKLDPKSSKYSDLYGL